MKKVKIMIMSATMVCGLMIPQKASAYKYYVTLKDGTQIMFHASSKLQAVSIFRDQYDEGVLTSRPGGGYLDHQ